MTTQILISSSPINVDVIDDQVEVVTIYHGTPGPPGAVGATGPQGPAGSGGQVIIPGYDGIGDVRIATGILRPTKTGTTVSWALLDDADHDPVFFTGVSASGNTLTVTYPTVKRVLHFSVVTDEDLQAYGVVAGASVGLSSAAIKICCQYQNNCVLTSNGTSWSFSSRGNWVASCTHGASNTLTTAQLGQSTGAGAYAHVPLMYAGTNNRTIRQVYSGLGVRQTKFELVDPTTGLAQTPNANDKVIAWNPSPCTNLSTSVASVGTIEEDVFGSALANFWVQGIFVV